MYSKMLKYLILIYVISSCNSAPRVGIYTHLIFVQHWPVSSFLWLQMEERNETNITSRFTEHLREHDLALNPQRWMIYGLWPVSLSGIFLLFCKTYAGESPLYSTNSLTAEVKGSLKNKWPGLMAERMGDRLWAEEYNMRGSCISDSPSFYFIGAMDLSDRHNVWQILANSGIFPGSTYEYDRVNAAITGVLGKNTFIYCTETQNSEAQFLLEVQLCFTPLHELTDCKYKRPRFSMFECDRNKRVTYI